MRLQELYYIIQKKAKTFPDARIHFPHMSYKEELKSDSTHKTVEFINAYPIYSYLLSLEELPGFQNVSSTFLKIIDYNNPPSSMACMITMESAVEVKGYLNGIRISMLSLMTLVEELGISKRKHGFDIKLPPHITLRDLSVLIKDLDSVFSQCPLFKKDDGQITYSGVDVGSTWLTFTIGGASAVYILNKLAEFVDKCIMIRSHWLTCKQQEESTRKLKLSNDILDALKKSNQVILEKAKEQVLSELATSNDITDPEDKERLKFAMNLFIEQMNKGLEIYASIEAPEEIKAAFPPIEAQALPDTSLKMLTGTDSSESVTD